MSNESMNCRNFTSVALKTNLILSKDVTLQVPIGGTEVATLVMPCSLSALVIYLDLASAAFKTV